ncbi:hypothetical protein [Intestinimonas butyriciproducens]|uniref:hypothetical protein n=1 Tax=Intestinimonas butyriciproducens TaxID=1297617 RepID=UPI00195F21BF|nr:hypothetical protein [Intestinimonas butyriciproducens]MBM6917721.1 hypothetical protein [Intestinimonas butyriciproducens]
MKKRILSLLLILCLSLGLLPAGALAAGTQTVKTAVTVDYGAAIEAVEYLNHHRRRQDFRLLPCHRIQPLPGLPQLHRCVPKRLFLRRRHVVCR